MSFDFMSLEGLALGAGWLALVLVGGVGVAVVGRMWTGTIDLRHLLEENTGGASFSRFQFLVFTFVIGLCVLVLTLKSGQFPNISGDVLGLLGISSGSYVVAKGIQQNGGPGAEPVQGPKGDKGEPGEKGDRGEKGDKGDA